MITSPGARRSIPWSITMMFSITGVILFSGCGDEPPSSSQPIVISTQRSGQQLYVSCQACHAPTGSGVQGMAPTLVNSTILGSNQQVVMVLRNGYKSGRQFAAIMNGFEAQLSDEEMVTLINWMRGRWAPASSDITLDELKAIRQTSLLGRHATPRDLNP